MIENTRRAIASFIAAAGLAAAGLIYIAEPAQAVGGGVVSILQCTPGPVHQVDPIINPDGSLSAHMHQFFAGEAIKPPGQVTTVNAMLNGSTTCPLSADTAGYWVPTLHRANGTMVQPQFMNVYYRSGVGQDVRPFALGDGMVCGAAGSTIPGSDIPCEESNTHNGGGWGCTDQEAFPTIAQALPCPDKLILHVQMNPVDDTLPKVTIHVRYQMSQLSGSETQFHLSSDTGNGTHSNPQFTGGTTLHGDFWNTWDPVMLQRIIKALDQNKTCKGLTDANFNSCLPQADSSPTPTTSPSPTDPPGADQPNPVITATSQSAVTGSSQDGWSEDALLNTAGSDCGDFGPLTNVKINFRDGTGATNAAAPFSASHTYHSPTKPQTFFPKVVLTCDGQLYEAQTSFVLG